MKNPFNKGNNGNDPVAKVRQPANDKEAHQLATYLRKIAQKAEAHELVAISIVTVTDQGVSTVTQQDTPMGRSALISELFSAMCNLERMQAAERLKAQQEAMARENRIVAPTGDQAAAALRTKVRGK